MQQTSKIIAHGMYEALLFDLDQTLLDHEYASDIGIEKCHEKYFSTISLVVFKEKFKQITTDLWRQVAKGLLLPKTLGLERAKQLCAFSAIPIQTERLANLYNETLLQFICWLPGAEQALKLLHSYFKIGIITNGPTTIQQQKYNHLKFAELCDCFLISEDVNSAKPDKKIFELALQQLDAKASLTLMVGDSLSTDLHGAINMAMDFCWINPLQQQMSIISDNLKFNISSVSLLPELILNNGVQIHGDST